jgi:hypothetical protein
MMGRPPPKTQRPTHMASLLPGNEDRVFRPDPELPATFPFADDPVGIQLAMKLPYACTAIASINSHRLWIIEGESKDGRAACVPFQQPAYLVNERGKLPNTSRVSL